MTCCAAAASSAYKLIMVDSQGAEEDLGIQVRPLVRVVKQLGVQWAKDGRAGNWRIYSEVKGERNDHGKLTVAEGTYTVKWD